MESWDEWITHPIGHTAYSNPREDKIMYWWDSFIAIHAVISVSLGKYLLVIFRPMATDHYVAPILHKYSSEIKAPICFITANDQTYMGCIELIDAELAPIV
jgi:hypothetical protein